MACSYAIAIPNRTSEVAVRKFHDIGSVDGRFPANVVVANARCTLVDIDCSKQAGATTRRD